jgi:hypothetical protein
VSAFTVGCPRMNRRMNRLIADKNVAGAPSFFSRPSRKEGGDVDFPFRAREPNGGTDNRQNDWD